MKQFPEKLKVSNRETFSSYHKERTTCYLRREIYDHMLTKGEEEDFDLDVFMKQYMPKNRELFSEIVKKVTGELEDLGWTCKTSYGSTALFIFSDENSPPERYYPDGM